MWERNWHVAQIYDLNRRTEVIENIPVVPEFQEEGEFNDIIADYYEFI